MSCYDPDCWCEECVTRAAQVWGVGHDIRERLNPFLGTGDRCTYFAGDSGHRCQLSVGHDGAHSFGRPKVDVK